MLQPLRGKILVQVLEDSKRTESGLYLAGIKEEVPHRGLVVEMGLPYRDKKQREYEWGFQRGHIVHFKRVWSGEKNSHIVLRRDQIYAIECEDKAYAIGEYVIIRKLEKQSTGKIILPHNCEVEVAKQIEYGEVISVGRYNTMGIDVGNMVAHYKNEGLAVRIPLQEELWSLLPRAILGKVIPS